MQKSDNPPYAIYQSVDIDADPTTCIVNATTVIWIGFKKSLQPGSVISLHCRQCNLKEVYINNIPAEYIHKDGLKALPLKKNSSFLAEELDSYYRASLEIARAGELHIIVPELSQYKNQGSTDLPQPIPKNSPRDVIDRYEKLVRLYSNLTAVANDYSVSATPREQTTTQQPTGSFTPYTNSPQNSPSLYSAGSSEDESIGCGYLFQIKIEYEINCVDRCAGITFRKQTPFASSLLNGYHSSNSKASQSSDSNSTVQCIYTTMTSNGSLRDLDGIRCWLPCFDSLDQRLTFDVRIKAPRLWRIACCGRKISTYLMPVNCKAVDDGSLLDEQRRKISRFFTPGRIPAMNVGFFMGNVEMHKMPLYRVRSRIWVATGLQDAVCMREVNDVHKIEIGFKRNRSHWAEASQGETDEEIIGLEKSHKLVKRDFSSIHQSTKERVENNKDILNKSSLHHRRLYYNQVHHSVLGLDMATRILHKFCGHRFDYDELTIIFIGELGHDWMAFDGFLLIDARFLHDESQIYMETATHLLILRAYLYSWLRSSFPISSYEFEFIVHGTVEYLLNYYCEEVYGVEEAKYRYQKQYDTVVYIEKQGRGFPLANFFPETYEVFDAQYGQYLTAKSAVIFQLIEHRVGGKDPMRIALKQLIRSPGIYSAVPRQYKGANKDVINNFQSLFDATGIVLPNATPPTATMVDQALRQGMSLQEQLLRQKLRQQPAGPLYTNADDSSSMGAASPYTPSLAAGTPFSTMGGDVSPYSTMSQGGAVSPYNAYSLGNISPYHHGMGNISPYGSNYYMGSKSPYIGYGIAGTASPLHDPYAVSSDGVTTITGASSSNAGAQYDVSYSPVVDDEARLEAAGKSVHNEGEKGESRAKIAIREGKMYNEENKVEPKAADVGSIHELNKTIKLKNEGSKDNDGEAPNDSCMVGSDEHVKDAAVDLTASDPPDSTSPYDAPAAGESYYASMARQQNAAINIASAVEPSSTVKSSAEKASFIPPLVRSRSSGGGYTPSMLSTVKFKRQQSITSEGGWERDFSLLSSDCVSAETFVELIRHASGAAADVDKSFLDRYVFSSGIFFIRYHVCISQKNDSKSKFMYVTSDQVGYKPFGLISQDCCERREFPMRIAESRQDMISEPLITISAETQQFNRQALNRQGGRRRRSTGSKETQGNTSQIETASDIAQKAKLEAEKEMRKSALQRSRDIDHQLKYAVIDPLCFEVIEVQNASPDCLLVEQLYNDFDEHNVFFQCQALRSLSRATVPKSSILAAAASTTDGQVLTQLGNIGIEAITAAREEDGPNPPEKSARLELKAFLDCMLGAPTSVNDSKTISGSQFSVYVRAEAAFSLARWQNRNAPKDLSDSVPSMMWQGMHYLVECTLMLFTDHISHIPINYKSENECETVLRNAFIMALSEIKAKSGHTPLDVVNVLLQFAECSETDWDDEQSEERCCIDSCSDDDQLPVRANLQGTKEVRSTVNRVTPQNNNKNSLIRAQWERSRFHDVHDRSYYKAVLFYALSRIKFDCVLPFKNVTAKSVSETDNEKNTGIDHPIEKITRLAVAAVEAAFTEARAIARMNFVQNNTSPFPRLASGEMVVAAAICCLGQMDVNAVQLMSEDKITLEMQRMYTLDFEGPTERGPFTGFNYINHFLSPEAKMNCLYAGNDEQSTIDKDKSNRNNGEMKKQMRRDIQFVLCSPVVRAAAFEAFIRICFAMHVTFIQRFEKKFPKQSHDTVTIPEVTYVAAAVEALTLVLKHDSNRWVHQQAALSFTETVMGKCSRIVPQMLSLSNQWNCIGWSDPCAFTLPVNQNCDEVPACLILFRSRFIDEKSVLRKEDVNWKLHHPYKVCLHCSGKYMSVALRLLWKIVIATAEYDQTIRSTILLCWRYAFEGGQPFTSKSSKNDWENPYYDKQDLGSIADSRHDELIPVKCPGHVERQFEQALIYGPEYRDQEKHNFISNPTGLGRSSLGSASSRVDKSTAGTIRISLGRGKDTAESRPALRLKLSS